MRGLGRAARLILVATAGLAILPVPVASAARDDAPTTGAARAAAVEPAPRLTVVAPLVSFPLQFGRVSTDGAHVLIESARHPETDSASDAGGVWDFIAQRYVQISPEVVRSHFAEASSDGKSLAFWTEIAVTAQDTDTALDLYVVTDGQIDLVSVGTAASASDATYVADGGAFVIFRTRESLTPSDTNGDWDEYGWTRSTQDVVLLTPGMVRPEFLLATADGSRVFFRDLQHTWEWTAGGATPLGPGAVIDISADGERIFMLTGEALVPEDVDGKVDAYLLTTAGYELLTAGIDVDVDVNVGAVSSDQTHWIVRTTAALTADDHDLTEDLYLASREDVRLIEAGPLGASPVGASDDLSIVVLATWSPLVPQDTDGVGDLYRWSAAAPNAPVLLTSPTDSGRPTLKAVSPDGSRVVIETSEAILPEDVDSNQFIGSDVYEWHDGTVSLLSAGETRQATFIAASIDLKRVVFEASDALVPGDTDSSMDIYISDRDLTPPVATIQGPAGGTSGSTARIRFGSTGNDSVWFDCRLDAGPWAPCLSPTDFTGLGNGSHSVDVHAFDAAANRSVASASTTWTVGSPPPEADTTPPQGSIAIDAGAPYATSTTVTIDTPATDAESGMSQLALSNDGTIWTTRPYAPTQPWALPATNGSATVYAKWKDTAGNWSSVKTDTVILDTVAPTADTPGRSFVSGTSITSGRISVRIPWGGADGTSGIARYELQQQTDGGAWSTISSALTSATVDRGMSTQHDYAFRVRAVDHAGNIGAWAQGAAFRLARYGETNAKVLYRGTWRKATSAAFWGGAAKRSSAAAAKASLTFSGRSFAWIARMGPDRGKASIYVNGTKVATVNLYSPTYQNQRVAWTGNWSTATSRKVTVRVLGTKGHPRVDIDAFVTGG